jgi:S-methylmethionine-dependent homocysteine/selenocysteine methylase
LAPAGLHDRDPTRSEEDGVSIDERRVGRPGQQRHRPEDRSAAVLEAGVDGRLVRAAATGFDCVFAPGRLKERETIMREALLDRLERGDVLVLDGGNGSELHRRGVDLLRERSVANVQAWFTEAWSTAANNDAPEVVRQVHADYLRVGADVISANTFYSGPTRLKLIGADAEWERYLDAGLQAALETRDRHNPDAYVAGAFSPPWVHHVHEQEQETRNLSNTEALGKDAFVSELRAIGQRMADSGVDFILFEYVCHADDVSSGIEALSGLGLPLFIGIAEAEADGNIRGGTTIQDLEGALAGGEVTGVMFMCTELENVAPGIRILRDIYGGYIGGYPNNGYGSAHKRAKDPMDIFTDPDPPSTFAQAAGEWIDLGARLVGGCCGTGPQHVRAIRHAVDMRRGAASPVT